ncbi:helix-turn-helix transcriptional regulator [Cryobacterium sp. AP23]
MSDTTTRALDLLSLLQSHRHWSSRELADRLGVTDRTLRRDIERLRELGYQIDAARGAVGGYRLVAGTGLPPLLLTDDEGVAIAVGLRSQAAAGLRGGEHTTLSALAKIEQVLPPALRRRIEALQSHTALTPGDGPVVDADLLAQLALSCRDSERIRFGYTAATGQGTTRSTEPHMLVPYGRRWYLLAWDLGRADWRTFRLDRISKLEQTRVLFPPRDLSAEHAAALVARAVRHVDPGYTATVVLELPLTEARTLFGRWAGDATARDAGHTDWPLAGDHLAGLATALLWIPDEVRYTVEASEEVLAFLRGRAERIGTAAR